MTQALLTCCVERLSDELGTLKTMFPEHWAELALDQDKVPLDPDYARYLAMEADGQVLFVAMRAAGEIVGYFVGFVRPHIHYRTCLTLAMDIFWVKPKYRKGSAGLRLFKFVRQVAKQRGVQRIVVGSKLKADASVLFERLGYVEIERYFSLWIGD